MLLRDWQYRNSGPGVTLRRSPTHAQASHPGTTRRIVVPQKSCRFLLSHIRKCCILVDFPEKLREFARQLGWLRYRSIPEIIYLVELIHFVRLDCRASIRVFDQLKGITGIMFNRGFLWLNNPLFSSWKGGTTTGERALFLPQDTS